MRGSTFLALVLMAIGIVLIAAAWRGTFVSQPITSGHSAGGQKK